MLQKFIKYILLCFISIFFFTVIFFPQSFSLPKLFLLIIILLLQAVGLNIKRKMYSVELLRWFSFYISFYLIWILIGFLNQNPGAPDTFRIQIIWPILYFILITNIDNNKIIISIFHLLFISTISISIYNIYKLLEFVIPLPHLFEFDQDFAIGIHSGYIEIVNLNIGSLTFLMPFVFTVFLLGNDFWNIIEMKKGFVFITFFLSIVTSIISGRRALWFSILFTFLIFKLFSYIFNKSKKIKNNFSFKLRHLIIACFIVGFFSITINYIDTDDFVNRITSEFDASNTTARQMQAKALISGFKENIFFGTGFGVGVRDVVRSFERPWTYELTYHLYLYNVGIFGFFIFFLLLLFPILKSFNFILTHSNFLLLPFLISYLMVLFASSSNPYFTSSFDFEWMLFLPVGILNCLEINKQRL